MWLAPNLITTIGFSTIIASYCFFVAYSPNFVEDVPSWVYYCFAVMIFWYQILDNIDGRQARRTGSSSALGEFFDHACDSLFVTLAFVPTLHAAGVGTWDAFLMYNIWGVIPFYLAHWEEYYAGILILGQFANPTEAQLIQCAVFILSGLFGRDFFLKSVEIMGHDVQLYALITGIQVVVVVFGFFESAWTVYKSLRDGKCTWQKGSMPQSLTLLFPIVVLFSSFVYWTDVSQNDILVRYPHQCFLLYGFIFASMLNRMMIDRITKIPTSPLHWQLLVPIIGCAVATYSDMDQYVLFGGLGLILVTYFHFSVSVIRQFCDALKIHCFRIPYKKD
jgi:phosphatidylglycerophosphate synthase